MEQASSASITARVASLPVTDKAPGASDTPDAHSGAVQSSPTPLRDSHPSDRPSYGRRPARRGPHRPETSPPEVSVWREGRDLGKGHRPRRGSNSWKLA